MIVGPAIVREDVGVGCDGVLDAPTHRPDIACASRVPGVKEAEKHPCITVCDGERISAALARSNVRETVETP